MALLSQLIVRFGADIADFTTDMNRAARISKEKSGAMRDAFTQASKAIAGAAVAVGAATGKMVSDFTEDADRYSKLVDKLGGSTEAWSELAFVAERSGVKFEQLSMGLQRMTRRLGEAAALGKGEAKPALDLLGLSASELLNLPIDKQFEAIAEELSKIPNESTRAALAMKFFDSEGVGLVQTMGRGAKGIQELREEASRLGVTISTEAAAEAVRFKDRITDLEAATTGFSRGVAQQVVPVLADLATKLVATADGSNFAAKAGEFLANVIRVVVAGAIVLKNAFEAASHVLVAFGVIVVETFGALVSPVTRFTEAISIAFHELSEGNFRAAANAFSNIAGNVVQDFQDAGNAIANVVKDQMSEAFGDLMEGVDDANEMLLGLADTATDTVPPALQETSRELDRLTQNQIAIAAGFEGVDDVLSEVVVTAERRAIPAFKDLGDESSGLAAVMEQAWQNLDSTFQDVWTNFFETGKLSMDGIKDLFINTLAQMAHQAITRPIVMRLGAMMGLGGAANAAYPGAEGIAAGLALGFPQLAALLGIGAAGDSWGTGGAMLAGGALGALGLFSGIAGSAVGMFASSGIGTAIASSMGASAFAGLAAAAVPVIGVVIGALLGKLLTDKQLPQLLIAGTGDVVSGKIGGYGNKRIPFSTAFGDFMVYNQNDLGPDGDNLVANMIQGIKDFDNALAQVMTKSQLETVKDNLANWGWEWTAEAVNLQSILTHRFDQILTHFGYLTDGIVEYVDQFSGLEERTQAFARFVAAFNDMSMALAQYSRSALPDLVAVTGDTRTSAQRLSDFGAELRSAFAEFERTPEAMERITEALSNRYEAEIQYIQAIDALIQQIGASIERQRASLRGMLGTNENLTASQLLAQARSAMAGLGGAGSPEEIAQIVSTVQGLIQQAAQAAGDLPTELAKGLEGMTRDDAIRAALLVLDQLENAATSRANILRENALAEAAALREEAAEFAEAQQISLDDIVLATDATVGAINDQTVVIGDGNDRISDGVTETNALLERLIVAMTEKSDLDVIRGSKVGIA